MTSGAYSLRSIQGGIFSPVLGWATDRYGPRIVILFGSFVVGLSFFLMYFVRSLLGFYVVYGVLISLGMSAMLYLPTMTAISNWFIRTSSRALSALTVGAGVGGFVCAPAAALLINKFGWRLSFVVAGIVIWTVALPLALVIRHRPEEMGLRPDGDPLGEAEPPRGGIIHDGDTHQELPKRDWSLKEALMSRSFWVLTTAFVLSGIAHAVITVHVVPALTDVGITHGQAAFALGFTVLISIVGRLSFGWLGDYIDKRHLLMVTFLLQALGIFILMKAEHMYLVYLFAVLFGVGFGGGVPLDPAVRAEYFGRAAFAKIGGFMAPMYMLAGITGPLLAGHIFDITGTYRVVFAGMAMLQIIAAVVILFSRPSEIPERRGRGV